jgi:hypothetical protein
MNIGDITNVIVALTSIVAIVLAVYTFWAQNRQTKVFLGIQLLRDWENSFFGSPEMRRQRYITCHFFLYHTPNAELPAVAWKILDEFDTIGIYVNRRIVDEEIAWATFYYWLNIYWHLLSPYVSKLYAEHLDGVEYYKNIEEMYVRLTHFGKIHRNLPSADIRCSSSKVTYFLNDELHATTDPEWAVSEYNK